MLIFKNQKPNTTDKACSCAFDGERLISLPAASLKQFLPAGATARFLQNTKIGNYSNITLSKSIHKTFALSFLCSSATFRLSEPKDQNTISVDIWERLNFFTSEVCLAQLPVTSPDPLRSFLLSCPDCLPTTCAWLSPWDHLPLSLPKAPRSPEVPPPEPGRPAAFLLALSGTWHLKQLTQGWKSIKCLFLPSVTRHSYRNPRRILLLTRHGAASVPYGHIPGQSRHRYLCLSVFPLACHLFGKTRFNLLHFEFSFSTVSYNFRSVSTIEGYPCTQGNSFLRDRTIAKHFFSSSEYRK